MTPDIVRANMKARADRARAAIIQRMLDQEAERMRAAKKAKERK